MFLSKKFLFLFFGFFSFYAQTEQDIDKENKELSVTVENIDILKKTARLSDKESILLFYEYFGGGFLKYHVCFALFLYLWKLMFDTTFKRSPKYAKRVRQCVEIVCYLSFCAMFPGVFLIPYVTKLPICEKQHGQFCLFLLYVAHVFENMVLFVGEIGSFVDYFKKFDEIKWCLKKKNNYQDFKKYLQFYGDDQYESIMHKIINCKCNDIACICKNADHLKEIIEERSGVFFYCGDIKELFSKNFSDDFKLSVFNKHITHCRNNHQCHEKQLYYLSSLNTRKGREDLVLFYKELLEKNVKSSWHIKIKEFFDPSQFGVYLQLAKEKKLNFYNDVYLIIKDLIKLELRQSLVAKNIFRKFFLVMVDYLKLAKEKELDFYNDIFVIIKDLIRTHLQQTPLEKNIFHEFFSAIGYAGIEDSACQYLKNLPYESEDLLFDICKDMFQLIKEIESDEAKLFVENKEGFTPLETLLKDFFLFPLRQKLFEYIVKNRTINLSSFFKNFLLRMSKEEGFFNYNLDRVKYILSHKFDINAVDETGNTIMHYYTRNNKATENVIQCFIDVGCNLNIENNDGFYPLDYVDNTTPVFYFLTSKGAVGNKASILFKIKSFLNLEKQNKQVCIESLIDHLYKKDVKMNVRTVLDSIYPDFINLEHCRDNNDAIIFSCMQYTLEKNNDDEKKIIDELSMLQHCMVELCQNSNKYKINGIFGGYLPGLYGDWLLEIVQKRFEYNTEENFLKIDKVDTIFHWFLNSRFPCDFTRCCPSGQNVFHIISYGGLFNYFKSIFEAYKDRSPKNMYDALQAKGHNEEFSSNDSLDPITLIKKQKKEAPQIWEYSQLYEKMQKDIKYLENKTMV